MSLASVEGVVVALLFIVPGATGVTLRGFLWPTRTSTAFEELVHAVACSTAALLLLEIVTGIAGLLPWNEWRLGTFLINALLADALPSQLQQDLALWYRLLLFAVVAVAFPSLIQSLRTRPRVLRLTRVEHMSLYNDGFEALFQETSSEAAKWDERWRSSGDESPWIMVDTEDGRRYRGQVMWRSTPPEPPELILINVSDVSYPDDVVDIAGVLLIGGHTITRLWMMRPGGENPPAPVLYFPENEPI